MTRGYEAKKVDPRYVAEVALTGIEASEEEVLVDDFTRSVKRSLSDEQAIYLTRRNPTECGSLRHTR